MIGTPRNPHSDQEDRISWEPNSSGVFTLKSAYHLLNNQKASPSDSYKWIWKILCHPRQQFFFWLLSHNVIPSNHLLVSRGMHINPLCSLCGEDPEIAEHMFRVCSVSKEIWKLCKFPSTFFSSSSEFISWLKTWANCQDLSSYNIPYRTLFSACIWSIWNARNKKVFQYAPIHPSAISKEACSYATEFVFLATPAKNPIQSRDSLLIKWSTPEEGWLKLNIDGACDPLSKSISAGGIVRDQSGSWVKGFQQFLGQGNSLLAECWGALLGIKLAISINAGKIWIESDCVMLINLLNDQSLHPSHDLAPMISFCRSSLRRFEDCRITHVLREGNRCADSLAGNALLSRCNFRTFHSCPSFATLPYTMDRLGIHTPRGIG